MTRSCVNCKYVKRLHKDSCCGRWRCDYPSLAIVPAMWYIQKGHVMSCETEPLLDDTKETAERCYFYEEKVNG